MTTAFLCHSSFSCWAAPRLYLQVETPWSGKGSAYPGNCRTFWPPTDCRPRPECLVQHGCDQPVHGQEEGVTHRCQRAALQGVYPVAHLFFLKHISFAEDLHSINMTGVFLLHQAYLQVEIKSAHQKADDGCGSFSCPEVSLSSSFTDWLQDGWRGLWKPVFATKKKMYP